MHYTVCKQNQRITICSLKLLTYAYLYYAYFKWEEKKAWTLNNNTETFASKENVLNGDDNQGVCMYLRILQLGQKWNW